MGYRDRLTIKRMWIGCSMTTYRHTDSEWERERERERGRETVERD